MNRRQPRAADPASRSSSRRTSAATPGDTQALGNGHGPTGQPTASRDGAPNGWVTGTPTLHANLAGGPFIYHRIGNDDIGQAVTVQIDERGRALLREAGIAPGRRIPEPLVWKLRQLRCFYLHGTPAPAMPARRGPVRVARQDPTRQG